MVEAVVVFDYKAQQHDELTIAAGDIISNIRTDAGDWWEGELAGRRGLFPDNFVREIKKEGSQVTQGNQLADISNSSGIAGCDIRMVKKGESIKGRRCVVMFGYTPHRDDELELKPEDVIEIVQEVEEGWWEGHLNGRTAVFPSNFTRLVEEAFSSSSPPECSRGTGQQLNSEGQSKEVDCCAPYLVTSSMTEPKQDLLKPTKTTAIQETTKAPADGKAKAREFCKVLFPYEAQNEDELSIKEGDVVAIVSKECVDAGWWCGELGGQQGLFPDNFVKLLGCDRDKGRPKKPPPPDSSAAKPRSDTKLPLDAKKISPEQPESLPQRKEKKGEQLKPSADIRKPSVPPKKPLLLKTNKSLGQPAIGSPKPPQKPEQPLVTSIQSGGRHSMPEQGGLDRHIGEPPLTLTYSWRLTPAKSVELLLTSEQRGGHCET